MHGRYSPSRLDWPHMLASISEDRKWKTFLILNLSLHGHKGLKKCTPNIVSFCQGQGNLRATCEDDVEKSNLLKLTIVGNLPKVNTVSPHFMLVNLTHVTLQQKYSINIIVKVVVDFSSHSGINKIVLKLLGPLQKFQLIGSTFLNSPIFTEILNENCKNLWLHLVFLKI